LQRSFKATLYNVQSPTWRLALDWVIWVGLILALLMLATSIFYGLQIGHWRHDAFLYISKDVAALKVQQEGRWLNYLLFDVLQFIPGHLAWFLNLIFIGVGFYLVSKELGFSALHSSIFTLCCIMFPGLHEQNTWPVTSLPASVLFLIAVMAITRISWLLTPAFGILFFATIPSLYFILPLAILKNYEDKSWRGFLAMAGKGVLWGFGMIAGYLVSAFYNWQKFGMFGFEVASWRDPHPAHDLASLSANVARYAELFTGHVFEWLPTWGVWSLLLTIVFVGAGIIADRKIKPDFIVKTSYVIVVMISPYLVLLGIGILLQFRSLLPMAVGILAFPAILAPAHARQVVMALLIFGIGLPSGWTSLQGTRWYSEFTRINVRNVEEALPRRPSAYSYLVVDIPDIEGYVKGIQDQMPSGLSPLYYQEFMTQPDRVISAFTELGAQTIIPCQIWNHEKCSIIRARIADGTACEDNLGQVCVIGMEENYLLVSMRP